ncbi:MAG: Type 1 glutamine amidotransferase-like domain-containing protein [Firmicutes bacterium]|nr:Type 1 glutamine amidotransferase-like domain-containing protein [Bacillota bacterium]
MRLILTSSLGVHRLEDGQWRTCPLDDKWGLASLLKKAAGPEASGLVIASDPADTEMNDAQLHDMNLSFSQSGVELRELFLLDDRNRCELCRLLDRCGLVFLSGGHVPTENRFFTEIGLKQLLRDYDGTVVGTSAGSMNSADTVYAQPELPGEAVDHAYQRYLTGLGLTRISILPHFEPDSRETLDGLELMRDISLPDSFRRPFVCLSDGGYIVQEGREAEQVTLSGPAWLCRRGELLPLCGPGEKKSFPGAELS